MVGPSLVPRIDRGARSGDTCRADLPARESRLQALPIGIRTGVPVGLTIRESEAIWGELRRGGA